MAKAYKLLETNYFGTKIAEIIKESQTSQGIKMKYAGNHAQVRSATAHGPIPNAFVEMHKDDIRKAVTRFFTKTSDNYTHLQPNWNKNDVH